MKQMTRKEGYVLIILVFISLLIAALPMMRSQRMYEFKAIDSFFQTAVKQRGMEAKETSFIRRSYQIDERQYKQAQVYGHKGAMEVEEIAIFEVDDQYADIVSAACEKRISSLKQSFAGYGTTQLETLERAVVKQYGNLIVCVIANDGEALLKEMENAL